MNNKLIGCGFASRAPRGFRPRSLGRRTVGYGSVGRSGRARDLLRAAVPRSTTCYSSDPEGLCP
jgi:hypothetical protein